MTIDNTIIRNLENKLRASIPEELKQYLLVKYAQEPFPYEYSEQDLYANIERDINAFESNTLDVTIKTPSERWQEEREYLQELYFEKSCETRELLEYVTELERLLSEHGLESARMLEKRIALSDVV
jgi:hypothetical protein